MPQTENFTREEIERACAAIRREAALENARWQLKIGYGGLAFMLLFLVVVLCCGEAWSWWWLFYFVAPVMLVVNGHRVVRGKKSW